MMKQKSNIPALYQEYLMHHKQANLEFLRFVFIIPIVLYHFVRDFGFYSAGAYASMFFFVLSGFFLTIRFDNTLSIGALMFKKIKRYYPFVVLSLIVLFIFKPDMDLVPVLNNLLFNPILSPLAIMEDWFLIVLMWVTLFYGVVIKYCKQDMARLIIGCACCASILVLERPTAWMAWHPVFENEYIKGGIFWGLLGMGLGYLMAQYVVSLKEIKKPKWYYTLLEILSLSYAFLSLYTENIYLFQMYMTFNFAVLIYLFVVKQGAVSRFCDKKIFAVLGRYTLAIYLMHAVILKILFEELKPVWLLNLDPAYMIGATLVIVFAISVFSFYLVQGLFFVIKKLKISSFLLKNQ